VAGELETVLRDGFAALDRLDVAGVMRVFGSEPQGVDEISRRWQRGRAEVEAHVRQMEGAVRDIHSELRDVREVTWEDTGLVTGWLEQDYTMGGQPQHISAPLTTVLRREGGDWRIVLIHAVPLPEAGGS
jgi:ketosteroid isomerase-like protein